LLIALAVIGPIRGANKTNDLDGAWVLSGKWTGYMGLALKIRGDHYKYWFSSDVVTERPRFKNERTGKITTYTEPPLTYPMTGRLVVTGDLIQLRGPGDYYDRKWRRITYRGITCLLAEQHYQEWKKTGQLADDRLLFKLTNFNEKKPVLNYGGFEHPDGSVSKTSPR
jgi:hypothetical protein